MTKTNANYFRKTLAKNDVWIAPLAGVTDTAFRRICAEYGAELMTTEMVSAKGLFYNNRATKELLTLFDGERNTGVQIFGSDPKAIAEAIRRHLNQTQFAFIDINMGCPVKKVFSNGDGSALLADGSKLYRVAKAAVEASEKPVSAKIRIGIDSEHINCLENVRILEDAGIQAIAIHGRTKDQMYAGKADWDTIARVVDMATVPIIANGDVDSVEQYLAIKEMTKAEGVMIGRGILGNPFLIHQILSYRRNGTYEKPSFREKMTTAKRHFEYLSETKDKGIACAEFRKHFAWYTKGMPNSAKLRNEINKITNSDDMMTFLDEFAASL